MRWSFVGFLLALAASALADNPRLQFSDGQGDLHHGVVVGGKASRDTTYLLGGPGRLDGKFQDAAGVPHWQGWTHRDETVTAVARWQVSDVDSPTGTPGMWCGQESFANACGRGYGNRWEENLVFSSTVADPEVATVVRLRCVFNSDSEPGYDYFRIQGNRGGMWEDLVPPYDGVHAGVTVDETVTFQPGDYTGPGGNEVQLRLRGESDGAYSDEDCLYDSQGLAQVDDIHVTIGGEVFDDDFDDGVSHHWTEVEPNGCGDFAHVWQNLQDIDPCATNRTPQVAFIDDGVVVPGTGGSECINWCYGPGGYVVNNTGGLLGPGHHLDNLIVSPPLAWPAGCDGAVLTYDVYRHEDLIYGVSPGIFHTWHVRSADSLEELAEAPWEDRNLMYYGRGYLSDVQPVTDLLVPGRAYVQVALRCVQSGPFLFCPYDGTPAPYFDNVALKAFPIEGPTITARAIDLAQDSFPAAGDIDLETLANDAVRFDMARNISPSAHLRNDPGDSIVVDVSVVRAGAVLEGLPKMNVKMRANPLFDGVRQLPPNFTQNDHLVEGWVEGTPTAVADRYAFDLPDSTFFFPGDVIHYYFTAADQVEGQVGVTTLPDKLDGYGNYTGLMAYPNVFTVRALPTLFTDGWGDQPQILFWNDAPDRGRDAPWFFALGNLALWGNAVDVYETNGASAGVGNGLGGRATSQTLGGYVTLIYTCGDLGTYTLSNADFADDPSNDLGVLNDWFLQGDKSAFMTGDDLVSSLTNSGPAALAFRNSYLSVRFINNNILPLINNQTAPVAKPIAGNSVFTTPPEWLVYGGCPVINDFDAIETLGTAERLAQYMTPSGNPGYTYSAALRYTNVADVVILPYDFSFIQNSPDYAPDHVYSVRAEILRDVLHEFHHIWTGLPVAVPDARTLTVTAGPNPFNPRTAIALDLPRAGAVSLRLYDIRGRLVRTLQDGSLPEGRHELIWNGDDDAGRAMASGVYFYEVKAAGEERIGKLALVR